MPPRREGWPPRRRPGRIGTEGRSGGRGGTGRGKGDTNNSQARDREWLHQSRGDHDTHVSATGHTTTESTACHRDAAGAGRMTGRGAIPPPPLSPTPPPPPPPPRAVTDPRGANLPPRRQPLSAAPPRLTPSSPSKLRRPAALPTADAPVPPAQQASRPAAWPRTLGKYPCIARARGGRPAQCLVDRETWTQGGSCDRGGRDERRGRNV